MHKSVIRDILLASRWPIAFNLSKQFSPIMQYCDKLYFSNDMGVFFTVTITIRELAAFIIPTIYKKMKGDIKCNI